MGKLPCLATIMGLSPFMMTTVTLRCYWTEPNDKALTWRLTIPVSIEPAELLAAITHPNR
jgi:hypothetical protein